MNVSVLGGGSWGTALAIILANNGHDVTLWEYNKQYVKEIIKHAENKIFLPGINIPKEIKITNPNYTDGGRFVFGKKNEFFNFL